jgi:2-oxoisovalerate dehydrogenase E1 component beta subunit
VTSWTMSAALNRALHDAMAANERVVLLGEDIGVSGGVFRVTDGLLEGYGDRRVFDTPISEAGIVGAAVGLCYTGWRPVVELQFDAFSYPAFEQIVDHAAKMRMRTRGRVDMPITIRIPAFGGIKGKEHHGESPETYFAHTAGLKVAVPSSPLDAYALLRHAIDDPDPVIVLEPKARYWSKEEGDLREDDVPLGAGRVLRHGTDVTLISYGAMVARVIDAAEQLAHAGIDARVVDLRWLSPLDDDLLRRSTVETGRVVVVHEAPRHVGFGAEVAARAMELAFDSLAAPVARVTGWDVPYPPASLEDRFLPSVERIVAAAKETVAY